jgi:hypothetical protein
MAEVLILKRKHFAEDTKPKEWSDLKWAGRPLRGDIIEIRPDGYFRVEALKEGKAGWNRDVYCLIRIPKVDEKELLYLAKSYTNATLTTAETVRYKHQYRIPQWDSIQWNKNKVTVGGKEFEEWYLDFTKFTNVSGSILNKAG